MIALLSALPARLLPSRIDSQRFCQRLEKCRKKTLRHSLICAKWRRNAEQRAEHSRMISSSGSQELYVAQPPPPSFNKFNSLDRRALARRHQTSANLKLLPGGQTSGAGELVILYCSTMLSTSTIASYRIAAPSIHCPTSGHRQLVLVVLVVVLLSRSLASRHQHGLEQARQGAGEEALVL